MGAAPTDLQLLDAWRSGDAHSGSELFERHFDCVARFFCNKVSRGLDDLVQQTFLGCIEGRDRFRGDSQFRTYLLRIAHHVLCKHYRGRATDKAQVDFSVTGVQDLAPSPSLLVARKREHRLLGLALRRLPLEHQVVLELTYWERMSATEIAQVLEMPVGTVKTRLRRARQLVRDAIDELATSPHERDSTMADLQGWADELRDVALDRESTPASGGTEDQA